ncbi:MAG: hypothetical protein ACREBD_01695 [Blastocatellia bacterium]
MSQTLTLELPDDVYQAVKSAAEANGKTPAELAASKVEQLFTAGDAAEPRRQIPQLIYELLQEVAPRMGKTIEELAAEWVAKYSPKLRPQLSEEERKTAMDRLLRHAGAASLGYATGADNESIDADLAREYGSSHEEEN